MQAPVVRVAIAAHDFEQLVLLAAHRPARRRLETIGVADAQQQAEQVLDAHANALALLTRGASNTRRRCP